MIQIHPVDPEDATIIAAMRAVLPLQQGRATRESKLADSTTLSWSAYCHERT